MFNARFTYQAWGFLSYCASACVSAHVKIDKPEKTRSTHPNAQELRKHHSIGIKPGIEDRSLHFCCMLIRILRSFSAQQQLSSGPGVPKTPSQMGFLNLPPKSAFSHIFYRVKQALPKFVSRKTSFRMGETGYRRARNP